MSAGAGRAGIDIGDGGQVADVTTGDSAGRDIINQGVGAAELAMILWQINERLDRKLALDDDEHRIIMDSITGVRVQMAEHHQDFTSHRRALRRELFWMSLAITVLVIAVAALIIDRALWHPALGALLAIGLWLARHLRAGVL